MMGLTSHAVSVPDALVRAASTPVSRRFACIGSRQLISRVLRPVTCSMTSARGEVGTHPAFVTSPVWTMGDVYASRLSVTGARHAPVLPKPETMQDKPAARLLWSMDEAGASDTAEAVCTLSYSEVDDEGLLAPPELGGPMDTLCIVSWDDE